MLFQAVAGDEEVEELIGKLCEGDLPGKVARLRLLGVVKGQRDQ